jgi:hypothetical protein
MTYIILSPLPGSVAASKNKYSASGYEFPTITQQFPNSRIYPFTDLDIVPKGKTQFILRRQSGKGGGTVADRAGAASAVTLQVQSNKAMKLIVNFLHLIATGEEIFPESESDTE